MPQRALTLLLGYLNMRSKPKFPLMSDSYDENNPMPTGLHVQFPLHERAHWDKNSAQQSYPKPKITNWDKVLNRRKK